MPDSPKWQRARVVREINWPPVGSLIWVRCEPPKEALAVSQKLVAGIGRRGFASNIVPTGDLEKAARARYEEVFGHLGSLKKACLGFVAETVELLPQFRVTDPPLVTFGDMAMLTAPEQEGE